MSLFLTFSILYAVELSLMLLLSALAPLRFELRNVLALVVLAVSFAVLFSHAYDAESFRTIERLLCVLRCDEMLREELLGAEGDTSIPFKGS